jgi:hypothetical protein
MQALFTVQAAAVIIDALSNPGQTEDPALSLFLNAVKIAGAATAAFALLTSTASLLTLALACHGFYHFASIPQAFEHGKENFPLGAYHIANTLAGAAFVAGQVYGAPALAIASLALQILAYSTKRTASFWTA